MENLLITTLFGHLIGDFFFQFRVMADNKYLPGWRGFFWCSVHVLIYTLFVASFVQNFSLIFLVGVYLPHWFVDRYSLAYQWMRVTGGAPLIINSDPKKASFGAIIYVVIDQTIHLGCLYLLINNV